MRVSLLMLLLLAGCSTTVISPSHPAKPTTAFIIDSGHHSSLLLPDPHGGMIEYAFGDYQWFALGHKNPLVLIQALVSSPQSTLTRRWIFDPPETVIVPPVKIQRLIVDADRVRGLRERLDYQYDIHTDAGMVYSRNAEAYAVPCDQQYNLLHNCNNVTGEWIRELGARTEGPCWFSKFKVVNDER